MELLQPQSRFKYIIVPNIFMTVCFPLSCIGSSVFFNLNIFSTEI